MVDAIECKKLIGKKIAKPITKVWSQWKDTNTDETVQTVEKQSENIILYWYFYI